MENHSIQEGKEDLWSRLRFGDSWVYYITEFGFRGCDSKGG